MTHAMGDVLVGLEIHQQLDTGSKLFCRCTGVRPPGHAARFARRLRPVKSEIGAHDVAALFEESLQHDVWYEADANNSCLVERDEEPPRCIDYTSVQAALVAASALDSHVFEEIYPMRKTVIDGSNTSGFQRTMLVAQGGSICVGDLTVGVQSICLEEDSARLLQNGSYALDRLGIPLIEVALEPMAGDPASVRRVAQALGRLLRGTRMVARGIGTIRQDVNVSVCGGSVVEIKGVQYLDQLEKVIRYEAARQNALLAISGAMAARGVSEPGDEIFDVTHTLEGCASRIIQESLQKKYAIHGLRLPGYAGILGMEPHPNMRLGAELGQLAKVHGAGGILHSDELPQYGITEGVVSAIHGVMGNKNDDAFVLVAAPAGRIRRIMQSVIHRIAQAPGGVPAETRMATQAGHTVFMRPRPGAARMYPETDIPPILVSGAHLEEARRMVPLPWEEMVVQYSSRYGIGAQLAGQLLDSHHDTFERIASSYEKHAPLAASILCYDIKAMGREKLDTGRLTVDILLEAFGLLDAGRISKEAVPIILRDVASGRSDTIQAAIQNTGAANMDDVQISDALDGIIAENHTMIQKMGGRAAGPLMGIAMSRLRGRAPGQKVNRMIQEKIADVDTGA